MTLIFSDFCLVRCQQGAYGTASAGKYRSVEPLNIDTSYRGFRCSSGSHLPIRRLQDRRVASAHAGRRRRRQPEPWNKHIALLIADPRHPTKWGDNETGTLNSVEKNLYPLLSHRPTHLKSFYFSSHLTEVALATLKYIATVWSISKWYTSQLSAGSVNVNFFLLHC